MRKDELEQTTEQLTEERKVRVLLVGVDTGEEDDFERSMEERDMR